MAEADSWLRARPRLGVYQPCFPSHQWTRGGGVSSTCTYTLMNMDAHVDLRITNTVIAPRVLDPHGGHVGGQLRVLHAVCFVQRVGTGCFR